MVKKKKKPSFSDVLIKKPQLSTNEREIAVTVMKYLRSSSDRCGGRAQRKAPESAEAAEPVVSE